MPGLRRIAADLLERLRERFEGIRDAGNANQHPTMNPIRGRCAQRAGIALDVLDELLHIAQDTVRIAFRRQAPGALQRELRLAELVELELARLLDALNGCRSLAGGVQRIDEMKDRAHALRVVLSGPSDHRLRASARAWSDTSPNGTRHRCRAGTRLRVAVSQVFRNRIDPALDRGDATVRQSLFTGARDPRHRLVPTLRSEQVIDRARVDRFGARRTLVQGALQCRITALQLRFEELAEQVVEPQHRRDFVGRGQEQVAAIQDSSTRRESVRSVSAVHIFGFSSSRIEQRSMNSCRSFGRSSSTSWARYANRCRSARSL